MWCDCKKSGENGEEKFVRMVRHVVCGGKFGFLPPKLRNEMVASLVHAVIICVTCEAPGVQYMLPELNIFFVY